MVGRWVVVLVGLCLPRNHGTWLEAKRAQCCQYTPGQSTVRRLELRTRWGRGPCHLALAVHAIGHDPSPHHHPPLPSPRTTARPPSTHHPPTITHSPTPPPAPPNTHTSTHNTYTGALENHCSHGWPETSPDLVHRTVLLYMVIMLVVPWVVEPVLRRGGNELGKGGDGRAEWESSGELGLSSGELGVS